MLKIIVAAVISLSAPLSVASVAEAASTKVVVIKKDGHNQRRDHRADRRERGCVSKQVVKRVNGKRVVKTTKVCR